MKDVIAIVVTYNRLKYLRECIKSLKKQTVKLKKILVIDNKSTDGTEKYMMDEFYSDKQVVYKRLSENFGGAGGFSEGVKFAMNLGGEFFWIMDDDTIPEDNALEQLLISDQKLNSNWGFLSSNVRWKDGAPAKMNQLMTGENWSDRVDDGLIEVMSGTFVSVLIKRTDVISVGLPIAEFFIWGDDTEYTSRLARIAPGYFVASSHVLHKTLQNLNVDIINESVKSKVGRYFFSYRNSFYNARKDNRLTKYIIKSIITSFKLLFGNSKFKWSKFRVLYKGILAGFFFNPQIKYYNQ
ncbi:glycosyltransferase family 2 protein [Lactiplantibacillus modestisalitolerans]|uniref:Glycosyltransferase family 2 protein n=1 Tax=Lactiplantibacillus modestisalitolerans TaxID=1457219 RepID=A0ABV5WVP4_9LACO|nr:glycosyltransferase family 2 protein [Lactiplantibacillus modestisalitolerans]